MLTDILRSKDVVETNLFAWPTTKKLSSPLNLKNILNSE